MKKVFAVFFQKKVSSIILMLCISFGGAKLGWAQSFEGTIHYQIPQLKKEIGTSRLNYMIKGRMIRIEYTPKGSKKTSLLYRSSDQAMYLSISSLGGYVEVPPDDVTKNMKNKTAVFKKTGKTKTIAGRSCNVQKATVDGTVYVYCFVSGMGDFILPVNSMTKSNVPVWASFKFPAGKLPLEVTQLKDGQKVSVVMKATGIEANPLDKNLFSVFN